MPRPTKTWSKVEEDWQKLLAANPQWKIEVGQELAANATLGSWPKGAEQRRDAGLPGNALSPLDELLLLEFPPRLILSWDPATSAPRSAVEKGPVVRTRPKPRD